MFFADPWTKSLFPSLLNYVFILFYIVAILIIARKIQNKNIGNKPEYRYYVWGLFIHIFGAIALGLIYTLYYEGGGDTTAYYRSSEILINLFQKDPVAYFQILLGDRSPEVLSRFSNATGFPGYSGNKSGFFVVRVASIFTFFGLKNYFSSTILFASFFFIGYWKLFLLFTTYYPRYHKPFAFAVLFFPSVVFWASGISKDAITLSMTGWFLYSFFKCFIIKEKVFINFLVILISAYVIIIVKAYILVALVPGVFLLLGWSKLKKLKSAAARVILAPLASLGFLMLGLLILNVFSSHLGDYGSLESIIDKAILTYDDHTRTEHYGTNYYSLGHFDGTAMNFFSKTPKALMAGMFRPFLWEARNPVMILAGLENLAFLVMIIIILWRTGVVKTIKIAFDEPLVVFSLSFALVFAFAVGVSTANFGALVRLKTPLIPFLASGLIILYYRSMELKKEAENPVNKNLSASL